MTSKIEIYREVLAIEPASRVFLPLAKLLAQEGAEAEAMDVLRGGIGHHPDFLEAKFMLVDILCRQGRVDEAGAVFDGFCALFSQYPSVWTLWAAKDTGLSRDASLALRFLASSIKEPEVSWLGVMERGLDGVSAALPRPAEPAPAVVEPSAPETDEPPLGFSLRGADEVMALAQRIEALERRAPQENLPPECASEQTALVRTRTMADLLAKHGDLASSLEIYEELQRLAATDQERQELADRIQAVQDEAKLGKPASQPAEPEKPRAKLVSMLEALANRLDARATA